MSDIDYKDIEKNLAKMAPEKQAEMRELLKTLGIEPHKREYNKKPKNYTIPSEYYLQYLITCTTCDSKYTRKYKMEANEEKGGLISVEVETFPDGARLIVEKRRVGTCWKCKQFLMKQTKEDLVNMVLKLKKGGIQ